MTFTESLQQASAEGYKLIDARGAAWSDWTPARAVGSDSEANCDDAFCCFVGLGGVCCYAWDEPKVYFVDEASLAWLQLRAVGDFPPVIDPSEFESADPDEGDAPGDMNPGLGLGSASSSVPWWIVIGALLLLLRKRKR